jgi:hypothetical protein
VGALSLASPASGSDEAATASVRCANSLTGGACRASGLEVDVGKAGSLDELSDQPRLADPAPPPQHDGTAEVCLATFAHSA